MQMGNVFTDTVSGWVDQIQVAARGVGQWVGSQVDARIAQWNADLKAFNDAINAVQMSEGSSPELAAKRGALLSAGISLRDKINWVQGQLKALTGSVGLSGPPGQLGLLPAIIPAAVVAGVIAATALIYKFIDEVAAYLREERAVSDAIAAGQDPVKARQLAQASGSGGGLFADVSSALVPLVLIGAIAYVARGKL